MAVDALMLNRTKAAITEVVNNVTYEGFARTQGAATSDALWAIRRTVYLAGVYTITWARAGRLDCVWDNRAAYFPTPGAGGMPAEYVRILDQNGNPYTAMNPLQVAGNFAAYPSGLRNGGLVTEVAITDSAWAALPTTPLTGRNAICVQNQSDVEVKLNYDAGISGYHGVVIPSNSERFYDITATVIVYAKASTGSQTLFVEELS